MSKTYDYRDARVWPEDRTRWLRANRRRNDQTAITEALDEIADDQ